MNVFNEFVFGERWYADSGNVNLARVAKLVLKTAAHLKLLS